MPSTRAAARSGTPSDQSCSARIGLRGAGPRQPGQRGHSSRDHARRPRDRARAAGRPRADRDRLLATRCTRWRVEQLRRRHRSPAEVRASVYETSAAGVSLGRRRARRAGARRDAIAEGASAPGWWSPSHGRARFELEPEDQATITDAPLPRGSRPRTAGQRPPSPTILLRNRRSSRIRRRRRRADPVRRGTANCTRTEGRDRLPFVRSTPACRSRVRAP